MTTKKIIATIECRMTSSRLPGKVMMQSCGKPMLQHLVERISRVKKIDEIWFATTANTNDDCIEDLANRLNIGCFRGSEDDVLRRVLSTAQTAKSDVIVEITGDCPIIDPEIVSQTIDLYFLNSCDYAANCITHKYPLGMDVQVFSTALLATADKEGTTPEDREHVSWYFIRNPEKFKHLTLPPPPRLNRPEVRLTLDEYPDFVLIDHILKQFYFATPGFTCDEVINYLDKNPELLKINSTVTQRGI